MPLVTTRPGFQRQMAYAVEQATITDNGEAPAQAHRFRSRSGPTDGSERD